MTPTKTKNCDDETRFDALWVIVVGEAIIGTVQPAGQLLVI